MNREELRDLIIDDLKRTDMTAAASQAISQAISYFESEKWWFLETTSDLTTSASLASYAVPTGFLSPDSFVVTISGQKVPLQHVSYKEINEKDDGIYTGNPVEFCIYDEKIRFYPVPDATYTATLSYIAQLETTASATNAWTNVASDLIRYKCLKEIYGTKLLDIANAQLYDEFERREFNSLYAKNLLYTTKGRTQKTEW